MVHIAGRSGWRWLTVLLIVGIVGIICLMALGSVGAAAQDGPPEDDGVGPLSLDGVAEIVHGTIPIQGYLTNSDGVPLNSVYSVWFRIYDQWSGGTPLCEDDDLLAVIDGQFYGYIDGCLRRDIDGRQLYLGIQVESDPEMTPRQALYPTPYAWTLRPGAMISATLGASAILDIRNSGMGGRGLRSYALSETGANYGVVGASRSPDGYGGFFYNNGGGVGLHAESIDDGPDLVLGGNADTTYGDDGRLTSDPLYPSSDLHFLSNDGVRIDLDDDNNGEDADFEIRDGDNALLFNVDESGAVTYGGNGVAAFPRPAYDSGWVSIGQGAAVERTHNLGGSVDNYVVVLDFKDSQTTDHGIHNLGLGADQDSGDYYGAYYDRLTSTGIRVVRRAHDQDVIQFRVRIWVYN